MIAVGASTKAYWYLTRSTGVVSLVLLSAIVILGTLSPMRLSGSERWPRFAVGRLHRDLSLLVLVLLAIHIVTSVLDTFAPVALLDAVVPLNSAYRPLWLGFGALSFDLLLALTITSLVRRRLGYERWRLIHWLAYVSWPIAVLHSLGSGSDTKASWSELLTLACTGAVLAAIVIRIIRAERTSADARSGWISLALATPVGLAAVALWGPLQSGWAARAGTPASILHPGVASAAMLATSSTKTKASGTTPTRVAPGSPQAHAFSAQLAGRLKSSSVAGGAGAIVDMSLSLRGSTTGLLRVRLAGQPLQGGGLSLVGSQVDLSAPGLGPVLAGKITSLSGQDFVARVVSRSATYSLAASLQIDSTTGAVSGRLSGTPVH
jgi:sulfoxide reductase heme-binding subunit YedZ